MRRIPGAVMHAALLTVLLVLSLLPGAPARAARDNVGWAITLSAVTPQVATGSTDVVITGRITNTGATPAPGPQVSLAGSFTPITERDAIRAYADASAPAPKMQRLDRVAIRRTLAPGASATFRLTMDRPARTAQAPFGALPLLVSAGSTRVRTFAPYVRSADYEPLRLAVLTPLTLAADEALVAPYGPERTAAWDAQTGTTGRLRRLMAAVAATPDHPVTWAIDPTLLAAPEAVADARPTDPEAGAAWDRVGPEQRAETRVRRAFATDLATRLSTQDATLLPYADPDPTAMLPVARMVEQYADLLARARATSERVAARPSTDLAWPADGRLSTTGITQLRSLYPEGGLGVVIGAASSLGEAHTPSAVRAPVAGIEVLAYDDGLSNALLGLPDDPTGVVTGQRLLADSLGLLGEYPGTQRDVLLALPRSVTPGDGALRQALDSLRSAPWLRNVSLDELRASRGSAALPEQPAADLNLPTGVPVDPATGPVALTPGRAQALHAAYDTLMAMVPVRADGAETAALWSETLRQAYGSRWRTDRGALTRVITDIRSTADRSRKALAVAPETINFFADSGLLQLTVTNDLDVAVRDVRVEVQPLGNRLRITSDAEPLDIGPRSRATVRLRADVLAAGDIPLRVTLSTPQGRPIGTSNTVMIRAFPTGSWIYWVIGGIAAALFVAGLLRSRLRKGHR